MVSNASSEVPSVWRGSLLADIVDVQVFLCAEEFMKPDRRIFELAASLLGIEPSECLYVGDGADNGWRGGGLRIGRRSAASWRYHSAAAGRGQEFACLAWLPGLLGS
jgi:putative hydrolase of the HAD superfamily